MFRRNTRGPVARAPLAPLAALEPLETRRLFAITVGVNLTTGALEVWGDDNPETVKAVPYGTSGVAILEYVGGVWYTRATDSNPPRVDFNMNGGHDSVEVDAAVRSSLFFLINGGHGNDTLTGGTGNDYLYGRWGHDTIYGRGGNDSIWGDDGDDTIDGGNHGDVIRGGSGNDTITGGKGSDYLYGDAGDDDIFANDNEVDTIDGGDGTDYADFDGRWQPDFPNDSITSIEQM